MMATDSNGSGPAIHHCGCDQDHDFDDFDGPTVTARAPQGLWSECIPNGRQGRRRCPVPGRPPAPQRASAPCAPPARARMGGAHGKLGSAKINTHRILGLLWLLLLPSRHPTPAHARMPVSEARRPPVCARALRAPCRALHQLGSKPAAVALACISARITSAFGVSSRRSVSEKLSRSKASASESLDITGSPALGLVRSVVRSSASWRSVGVPSTARRRSFLLNSWW
mmetsp:Transcript_16949/g.43813  ORF Transcript_16949/g.43813 Transcript_16949/m.43813 type:complete len:227 (+) Transcript_16949:145-825(+)